MSVNYTTLLAGLLRQLERMPLQEKKRVFVGFDGFIDTVKKAVKQRKANQATCFETLGEFSDRIRAATGRSGQIEMLTERVKLGGNAPILSNALGRLGIKSCCLGSMGFPEKHTVFLKLSDQCEVMSALDPGQSEAIEFSDGKMIFSELSVFDRYDWAYIVKTIGLEKVRHAVLGSDLLAFVDWANLPHASDIWQGVLQDIIKPSHKRDFLFLFDLCDPSKKTPEEIEEVLDLISCFSHYGKVTLGLNENETFRIWCALHGIDSTEAAKKNAIPSLIEAGDALYKTMRIDYLLVHPIDRTLVYRKHEVRELLGRLVTQPKVLTGGGDNLNAGYCLGQLCGFSIEHCMLLGMASSGAYIENGESPDLAAIERYIRIWMSELGQHEEKLPRTLALGHGIIDLNLNKRCR
ncbi:MAG TPA: hypothetical protein VIU12_27380 [Chryseolinea sp.]